jgi:hypothetical protein
MMAKMTMMKKMIFQMMFNSTVASNQQHFCSLSQQELLVLD